MTPSASTFLVGALAAYGLGALAALLLGSRPTSARYASYLLASLGGVAGIGSALRVFGGNAFDPTLIFHVTPYVPVVVGVDSLTAWFVFVLSVVGTATSVAAVGYARDYDQHGGPRLALAYNLFLASMLLVLVVESAFAFLVIWEAMSLVSYLLVVHEDAKRPVRRAGFIYLVMTHVGTAFLVFAFIALASAGGGFDFASLRLAGRSLDPTVRGLIFLFGLVGFGTKAGLVPLHVWLPRAHPVAPSHVSALMSGVMLKIAIYGFVRLAFDLLGGGPPWWGWLVLATGVVSAVLGILYALAQHDLKTLLAYCSVENVGVVLVGLGASLVLANADQASLAALALAAALFHVLNHALYKALLFLGAGAIDQATGTKNLDRLGGLARRMPQTAVLFVIGALAISALPPLNGFASEWLTFQALLGIGGTSPLVGIQLGAATAVGLLALSGALAAAAFVKAYGVAFLALPRSAEAECAVEAPVLLRLGMLPLAVGCVGLGLLPNLALLPLGTVTTTLLGVGVAGGSWDVVVRQTGTSFAPLAVVGALLALGATPLLLLRWPTGLPDRSGPAWVCGWDLKPSMQYGATAFANPIRLFFRSILRPEQVVERDYALEPHFVTTLRYRASVVPVFERHLYGPVTRSMLRVANALRRLQNGSLRLYLAYLLATLVALLILAR